jgi:predicted RND superfamily exporter protein
MSTKHRNDTDNYILSPDTEPFLEKFFFNNRLIFLVLFAVLTVFLGYSAMNIKPDARLEKLIPLKHPYIVNMMDNRDSLENLGNTIKISVENKQGSIIDAEYMEALKQITDELFYIPGVDRAGLKSLWTANVRWVEVTEEGFQGGPVIPPTYDGSNDSLETLRQNILRSGTVGSLVANNFQSTIISAPLFEKNPETGEKLDYQEFSHQLEERIRDKFNNDKIDVHIIGFAKKIGDLIDGIADIGKFALIAIAITFVLLIFYSRCLSGAIVPIVCSTIGVIWQLGILNLLGFGLDPYSVLVPFLVFAIGISHGVQLINAIAIESAEGRSKFDAARHAFRDLYVPGMLALMSDAIGFLTLLLIQIDVIQELAITASIGVGVIIFTNLVLLPLIMSYVGISKSGVRYLQKSNGKDPVIAKAMSYCAHPTVAPISIVIGLALAGAGVYYGQDLKIGDLDTGAPELHPDSRYNLDNAFITENYSTSADVMVVMVKTPTEQCSAYRTMDAIDRFQWTMENVEGVQGTASLVTVSKIVSTGMNEGNLKWKALSRNQQILNSSIQRAPAGLISPDCSIAPVIMFLADHKAETLERVTSKAEEFAASYDIPGELEFLLAAGPSGIDAATNQVIEEAQGRMLIFVYAVVSILCFITFRSIRAVLCIITPLAITSVLCEALMVYKGIGVKVETLPVIALGVGIGVDYGIYIYSRLETYIRDGLGLQDAYLETLKTTGKAVAFTGVTLAIGVVTWIWSSIKFQTNMGFLLTFMFLWNMVGALWLLPALARFFVRPEQILAKERARQAREAEAAKD